MNAKFTQKVETYLSAAAELAQESSHQQLSPLHLAITMFEDPEGIGKQSVVKAGGVVWREGCAGMWGRRACSCVMLWRSEC